MIAKVSEKSISVSYLCSHPKRPFQFVSSHFDNSVIFWDIYDIKEIMVAKLKICLDLGLVETWSDSHD